MPTFLDLMGAKNAAPKSIDGISLAPTLLGDSQPERPFLYREFPAYGGQQMVRIGDWKGIRQNLLPKGPTKPNLAIELYNIKNDIGETTNVASQHPEIVAQIESVMLAQHVNSTDFPFPALDVKGTQAKE